MEGQQLLVAYPCMLLYGVFALLTVFWDDSRSFNSVWEEVLRLKENPPGLQQEYDSTFLLDLFFY